MCSARVQLKKIKRDGYTKSICMWDFIAHNFLFVSFPYYSIPDPLSGWAYIFPMNLLCRFIFPVVEYVVVEKIYFYANFRYNLVVRFLRKYIKIQKYINKGAV